MKKLYSVKEAAELLGYAEQTIYNKIYNSKEIKAVKLPSGKVRIEEDEIKAIFDSLKKIGEEE